MKAEIRISNLQYWSDTAFFTCDKNMSHYLAKNIEFYLKDQFQVQGEIQIKEAIE